LPASPATSGSSTPASSGRSRPHEVSRRSPLRPARARGKTHNQALRALANRLVGILHGCLARGDRYREDDAWPVLESIAA
jgi:hypothetical protein